MYKHFRFVVFLLMTLFLVGLVQVQAPILKVVKPTKSGGFEAEWELPSGAVLREIIANKENTPDEYFGLQGPGYSWSARSSENLKPDQTRFSSHRLDPGTYYIRIGFYDQRLGPGTQWSNIIKVKVTPPQFSESADLYKGKTDQNETILLRIAKTEVQQITVRAHCGDYSLNEVDLYGPFPLGQAEFEARHINIGYGGGVTLIVKGRLVDKNKAEGIIQFIASDAMRRAKCSNETKWNASRLGLFSNRILSIIGVFLAILIAWAIIRKKKQMRLKES